jgi:glycosyltransferase involved in cell wall biosynthesis
MVPSILGMTGALARQKECPVNIVTTSPSRSDLFQLPASIGLYGPETDFRKAIQNAGAVHMHGLWQKQTRVGCRVALQNGVPYVIAAHGMAEPWAMKQKALKKKIYMQLVEGRLLRNASCLHALTMPESQFLRQLTPRTPIAWIPNGVDAEPLRNLPERKMVEARYPQVRGKFTLLFLSRLHVKKGLDLLAEALKQSWGARDDWHMLLAGTEDGAGDAFVNQMQQLGLGTNVTRVGHVAGEQAREMWALADAFILPSRSEGFSMAVLESLAAGVPSIITTACHFPELATEQGGLVCEPDIHEIAQALNQIKTEMSSSDRENMARRGRELVERNYTWDSQARKLMSLYRWIQGGGPRPDFVS